LLRLIEQVADINHGTESGGYAITLAARKGHTQAFKLLLDHGAHPSLIKHAKHAPLLEVAENNSSDIARLLLERDANTEGSSYGKSRPLYEAAHAGHLEIVRLLMDCGANSHAVSEVDIAKGDVNAVYWAARSCHASIVEGLLAAGVAADSAIDPNRTSAQIGEDG
jgi:ankyrin repeat protein